jgi:hypothetical protein
MAVALTTQEETKMPIRESSYGHRGKSIYGAIVRLSSIVGDDRLVYFTHNRQTGEWVIRDYVSGYCLRDEDSALLVADIENDADCDEKPPHYNRDNEKDWPGYIRLLSMVRFNLKSLPPATPNPESGLWTPL